MRPATLFLVTWVVWVTAKGRAGKYWELATVPSVSSSAGAGASGSGANPSASLPDIRQPSSKFIDQFKDFVKGTTGAEL